MVGEYRPSFSDSKSLGISKYYHFTKWYHFTLIQIQSCCGKQIAFEWTFETWPEKGRKGENAGYHNEVEHIGLTIMRSWVRFKNFPRSKHLQFTKQALLETWNLLFKEEKTLWKKEKMLATSIFSFSHNILKNFVTLSNNVFKNLLTLCMTIWLCVDFFPFKKCKPCENGHFEFNTVFWKSCIVFCAKPKEVDQSIKLISLWQIGILIALKNIINNSILK